MGPPPGPKITIKRDGQSAYQYPVGRERALVNVPLGPVNPPRPFRGGKLYGFAFEVSFPAGTKECPNHVHQYIKDTITYGDGTEERSPPASPGDLGGYDSKNWAPDPPPDGTTRPGLQTNADGTKSYIDSPGFAISDPKFFPTTKKTKFKWVLHDCNHKELDCLEAELTVQVDKNGNYVALPTLTAPQKCQ